MTPVTTSMRSTRRGSEALPTDCWYALADSASVGRALLGLRAVDRPVLLYRTQDGSAVALEDRCAHRAYPLSAGRLEGDSVRCGLCGFSYGPDGECVAVPSQPQVPFGARLTTYRVIERDGLVWVWLGAPGRSVRHRVPELPWLARDGWAAVGGQREVAAGFLLLHENFADVTQVPFVAPEIAPSVLGAQAPDLTVEVTETTVTLRRSFAPAPLPAWQADMLGARGVHYSTAQAGFFVSPAAWVDHWDVTAPDSRVARLRFAQLVTPIEAGRSRVLWRVSRDFAVEDADAGFRVAAIFEEYYGRVFAAMETAQAMLDRDGPGPEVNVSADVAALRVREIVESMLAGQRPPRPTRAVRASRVRV
jgi:vanillate O-demethylase monooxygenase subunit